MHFMKKYLLFIIVLFSVVSCQEDIRFNNPSGTSSSKTATYVLTDSNGSITFATGSGIGDGQIKITEYDDINNTVSGTFKFNAENIYNNPLAGPVLNFQQGVFYKIPITTTVQ